MKSEDQRKVKAFDRFKIVAALAFASIISFIQLGFPVGEKYPWLFWAMGIGLGAECLWQLYIVSKGSNTGTQQ